MNNKEINNRYIVRKQPDLELVNTRFNSLYQRGQIYEVTFDRSGKIYVSSTCDKLEERLKQHVSNKKSAVYKYRTMGPQFRLIVKASSECKKSLEKVKNTHIEYYAEKYGERLINKRSNPNKKKQDKKHSNKERKIQYQIEKEDELRQRIAQLKKED